MKKKYIIVPFYKYIIIIHNFFTKYFNNYAYNNDNNKIACIISRNVKKL
jgi:hypothetical protein